MHPLSLAGQAAMIVAFLFPHLFAPLMIAAFALSVAGFVLCWRD